MSDTSNTTNIDPLTKLVIKLGAEIERQGLNEGQLMAELEESKHQVFEDFYGEIDSQ